MYRSVLKATESLNSWICRLKRGFIVQFIDCNPDTVGSQKFVYSGVGAGVRADNSMQRFLSRFLLKRNGQYSPFHSTYCFK